MKLIASYFIRLRKYFTLRNTSNEYVLNRKTIFDFEKSKSVVQSPFIMDFEISKFENTLNFEVFRSGSFVMQKLSNYFKNAQSSKSMRKRYVATGLLKAQTKTKEISYFFFIFTKA